MQIKVDLSASEKRIYNEDYNFRENYKLKQEIFDLINTYIDRESATSGFEQCNNYLSTVLIPIMEKSFGKIVDMKDYQFLVQSKETEH